MKIKLILFIIFTFFSNNILAQINVDSYSLKKSISKRFFQSGINIKSNVNSVHELTPVYTDNMVVDQNIVRPPGGWGNQIMNATWAYGHFTDQYGNNSPLFENLENAVFLPFGSTTRCLAIDARLCSILYFDQNNILAGVNHYGTYGEDDHNFRTSKAFVLGKEVSNGSETDFNIFICDEINNRIVHVVYHATPDNVYGFDGTPFDVINNNLKYPSDISYFQCIACGPPGNVAPDVERLWVSCDDNSMHCLGIDGVEEQNIVGYQSPEGDDYYFLPDSRIKLTVHSYIHSLAFVDTRRNCLVNCLLTLGGTGDVISIGNGKYLIKASAIISFPDDMKINSVRYHQTSDNIQASPYLWVTSGYLPPYDDNTSVLHAFKGYESGYIQYLGSTKKPTTTDWYFHDLKNTAMRDGYFDLFTIEHWQESYGVRRYLPFADIYNDSLKNYCLDSLNYMEWKCMLTNDCNIRITAERMKDDGSWEGVSIKKIDEQIYNPPEHMASIYRWAGNTNTKIQLNLPLQDYVLGGNVRLHVQLYPEYDWTFLGNHIDRDYQVSVLKSCIPKPGGCPYIYVYDSLNNFYLDNNILHRSEFPEFQGRDIMDRYKLQVMPSPNNNQIRVDVVENENDHSFFDQFKLYAVDHPEGTIMGVTEENEIAILNPADVISTDSATLTNLYSTSDITHQIQYNSLNIIKVQNGDTIYAHYPLGQLNVSKMDAKGKQNTAIINRGEKKDQSKEKSNNNIGTKHSLNPRRSLWGGILNNRFEPTRIAMITYLGNLDTLNPVASKNWAADVTAIPYSLWGTPYNGKIARRERPSEVVLPLFTFEPGIGEYVKSLQLKWTSDANLNHLAVVPIDVSDYYMTEITLDNAIHTTNGNVLDNLLYLDGSYAELESTAILKLYFSTVDIADPPISYVRDYIFETNGRYIVTNRDNILSAKGNQVPFSNKLYNNYPNPFNPVTNIKYEINKNINVKITIYNILGQEVKILVNEFKKAGNYEIKFDGTNLASGIYFYRIEAGDFIEAKKMVLIK